MLSLHFLVFQVELVTEMAIPLLLGFRLLSQMSSCSHCWGTVGKIYEPLPVKRAMWLSDFVRNDLKQNVYSKSFGRYWGCSGCRSFQVFQSQETLMHTQILPPKKCPSSKGCFAPGCSLTEALLGSPAPEYGVRWNGKSQWRWNLFCRENTAGYRSICRLLYIYIPTIDLHMHI